jgi:manganese-dependent inorganic pyrophosphatase
MDPVYVIGHKNPDTDAICSAIGYAAYLRDVRGMDAQPACCGEINTRTNWVLNRAGVTEPKLIMDVRPTAASISRREIVTASGDETFLSVYRDMLTHHFRSIPVVSSDGCLLGIPSLEEMAQLFLPPQAQSGHENRKLATSLQNIVAALEGTLHGSTNDKTTVNEVFLVVAASSLATTRERARQFPPRQTIIVTGDRPEIHDLAIEIGARCLIITGGFSVTAELESRAKANQVSIIAAAQDTASASQLIRFSRPIAGALRQDYLSFGSKTPLREIIHAVQDSSQPLFPVLEEETGRLIGVFSKSDLVDVPRTKLVLVDHNEFSQAVAGADEAEIIEVIDHHRLSGNLRTKEPIRFLNEPVGSTSTIVGIMYRMRGAAPEKATALCLCAGIIADTLHLTSPTTTETDREILTWLSGVAGINGAEFVQEFFAAGSMLRESTPERALESDRKVFEENGWRMSISQIEELGLDVFAQRETDLHAALVALLEKQGLHFACLMVTDITEHDSVLLVAGNEKLIAEIEYPELRRHVFELAGVVSRKKQLFPYLSRIVAKVAAP